MTSFVPSGNVASTWISGIISGTPSITWSRDEQRRAVAHQLGDGAAVARAFDDRRATVRDRLGIVELDAAREPALGEQRRGEEQQLVFFSRREFHVEVPVVACGQVLQMRGAHRVARRRARGRSTIATA